MVSGRAGRDEQQGNAPTEVPYGCLKTTARPASGAIEEATRSSNALESSKNRVAPPAKPPLRSARGEGARPRPACQPKHHTSVQRAMPLDTYHTAWWLAGVVGVLRSTSGRHAPTLSLVAWLVTLCGYKTTTPSVSLDDQGNDGSTLGGGC